MKKIGKNEAYYPLINLQNQWCDDLCIGIWIQEIAKTNKTNKINQLNNNLFHLAEHENETQLIDAITFHKVITKEQYEFYTSIAEKDTIIEKKVNQISDVILQDNSDTVFTLVTDLNYFNTFYFLFIYFNDFSLCCSFCCLIFFKHLNYWI